MAATRHKPLIWLPACHRHLDLNDPGGYSVLADRYALAVTALGLQPVLFPMAEVEDVPCLLPLVDGVLLTGSPSNVEATHFGATALSTDLLDPRRDKLTMRLVRESLERAVPIFGVCRGLQEMNVALGGSLHQSLHDRPGMLDHREPENEPLEVQFGERHEVLLEPGSQFAEWAGGPSARVNSLHGQGINRLGEGLRAEAHAPDGLVEGVRVQGARTFAYGVQWHPEWQHEQHPFYERTLRAFADACRAHMKQREEA
ncbi:gamma-glutamyl-gamma-aminobutyrate hydrolase family protein [Ramlibacter alkalitolerans]|uniref:Gamma-glutamyl-gamma-aminobutyrate hydrolase family protein n=1 Tax=Ramlibacter alkalitolerans TaxID=2039631 RepID=A0ABS1JQM2_9BURK|nr:gamma-glutamyl-gamma-aminobutyrate hydrolase family protein [Ramlibacter alkalitolerans]MBL0426446.1 gamma-glutamyl-gamma-aminobutyrate hydrolase family protein [Ramlibacter alkalitolerans]